MNTRLVFKREHAKSQHQASVCFSNKQSGIEYNVTSKSLLRLALIYLVLNHALVLTRKAIFFNLFIAENCLRRESTAGSSALSGATPFSHIQGWPKRTIKKDESQFDLEIISNNK
jgi:hypothetical protein